MENKYNPPPLLVSAVTSKSIRTRKTIDEKRRLKKQFDRVRSQSGVNIGANFTRWRELRKRKRFSSDAELAVFLLDSHERVSSLPTESSLTNYQNSMAQEDNRMSSSDDTGHVSDEEETSEESSFKDDSSDEDYAPGSSAQMSCAVKVKKSRIATMCKEEIVHEAANSEPGERPPVMNNIQIKREPKKKIICPICGREFPHNQALKRHLVIHSGKRPFKCFICGRGFTQDGNLKTHMKVHKGELHKWALVQEKKPSTEAPVTANICGECGMDFPEIWQLEEHRESHKKPYACPDCGKTFKLEKSVEIHQRIHSGESPFRCSECGKTFGTAQSLKRHEAIHTEQKNFHCHQCGKSFLHYNYLKLHLKTHTGERAHLCSVCGKSYSRADTLRYHLRVHTGERPYTCEKCGKRFRFSQTYHAHLKRHDKKPKPPTRPLGRPKQQPLVGNDQNVPVNM